MCNSTNESTVHSVIRCVGCEQNFKLTLATIRSERDAGDLIVPTGVPVSSCISLSLYPSVS